MYCTLWSQEETVCLGGEDWLTWVNNSLRNGNRKSSTVIWCTQIRQEEVKSLAAFCISSALFSRHTCFGRLLSQCWPLAANKIDLVIYRSGQILILFKNFVQNVISRSVRENPYALRPVGATFPCRCLRKVSRVCQIDMALLRSLKVDVEHGLLVHLRSSVHQWCDILGFMPTGIVSSSSTF